MGYNFIVTSAVGTLVAHFCDFRYIVCHSARIELLSKDHDVGHLRLQEAELESRFDAPHSVMHGIAIRFHRLSM